MVLPAAANSISVGTNQLSLPAKSSPKSEQGKVKERQEANMPQEKPGVESGVG